MSIALLTMLLALGAPADAGSAPAPAAPPPAPLFRRDATLAGALQVTGNLDKEIVGEVIQLHLNDVRYCYSQQLAKKPDLIGHVEVRFTISPTGEVIASELQSSTMGNGAIDRCVVGAARRWHFPPPLNGATVVVTYPLALMPTKTMSLVLETKGPGSVEVTFLTDTEIVHRSKNVDGVPSNGLIAVTDHGLLLVDTAWTEAETEAVLKWGETLFHRPWIGAVITHDHADRDGGLGALQRRHIPVAALDLTVDKLEKRGVHGVTTLFTSGAATFTDPRGFEAFYPGPGHTSDNIVLKFPHALYGGCLLKSTDAKDLGFTADANLASWPEAVRRVSARYGKVTIVPGHGPIDLGGATYQHTLDLLATAPRK